MKWVKAGQLELNNLMREQKVKQVKSIALAHIVHKYYMKLSLAILKVNPATVDIFAKWDPAIRKLLIDLHLLISTCKLKTNTKRIRQSLGLLCSAYVNFVLQVFGTSKSKTPTREQYCDVANTMYTILVRMSQTAETSANARKQPLYFLNILLASQELVQSWKDYETAYFFLKLLLGHQQIYTQDPETYLKFLALINIFDNFNSKDPFVRNCLKGQSRHSVPSHFFDGIDKSKLLFRIDFDAFEGITARQIMPYLNLGNLIRSAKKALKPKPIPEKNLLQIKKYMKRIRKKRSRARPSSPQLVNDAKSTSTNLDSDRQDSSSGVGSYGASFDDCAFWLPRSETIDEIMTNGSLDLSVDEDEAEKQQNGNQISDEWPSDFDDSEPGEYQNDEDDEGQGNGNEQKYLSRKRSRHGSNDTLVLSPVSGETTSFDQNNCSLSLTESDSSTITATEKTTSTNNACLRSKKSKKNRSSAKDTSIPAGSTYNHNKNDGESVSDFSETEESLCRTKQMDISVSDEDSYAPSDASTIPYSGSGGDYMDSVSETEEL